MTTSSPQLTSRVGPGKEPLMVRPHLDRPSGASVAWSISSQNSRVTPVSGVVFV